MAFKHTLIDTRVRVSRSGPLPDGKHKMLCMDFDVLGHICPFYEEGTCTILSAFRPVPVNGECDKVPEMVAPSRIRSLTEDASLDEMKRVTDSETYKVWLDSYNFYATPLERRKAEEYRILWDYAAKGSQYYMDRRRFAKTYKPNDIGVTEKDRPTFRERVMLPTNRLRKVPYGGERSALRAVRLDSKDDACGYDLVIEYKGECWAIQVYTVDSTLFNYMLDNAQEVFDSGLYEEIKSRSGKKILIECGFWSDQPYEGEWDWGMSYVNFVREL